MKTKKFKKRLEFKKNTVANLNGLTLSRVRGGATNSEPVETSLCCTITNCWTVCYQTCGETYCGTCDCPPLSGGVSCPGYYCETQKQTCPTTEP
jgi:hypothetical protein